MNLAQKYMNKIQQYCERNRVSVTKLANCSGVAPSTLLKFMKGGNISVYTLMSVEIFMNKNEKFPTQLRGMK